MEKNYKNNRNQNQNRNNGKRYITALEREKLETANNLRDKYANVTQKLGDLRVQIIQLENDAVQTLGMVNQMDAINKATLSEKYPNCDIGENGEIIPRKESGI